MAYLMINNKNQNLTWIYSQLMVIMTNSCINDDIKLVSRIF